MIVQTTRGRAETTSPHGMGMAAVMIVTPATGTSSGRDRIGRAGYRKEEGASHQHSMPHCRI